MSQTNFESVECGKQTSTGETTPDIVPSSDDKNHVVPVSSKDFENCEIIRSTKKKSPLETCRTAEYMKNHGEEIKLVDSEQSNIEVTESNIEQTTNIGKGLADRKCSVAYESPKSKIIQISETTAVKDLAKVSNLIPRFECEIVDEIVRTKMSKTSPAFKRLLGKESGVENESQNPFPPLPGVSKTFNEVVSLKKSLKDDIEKTFTEKSQGEINQTSLESVESSKKTSHNTRDISSFFDDDSQIILDYKDFEKGVEIKDTNWQMTFHLENCQTEECLNNNNDSKDQRELTGNKIQNTIEPATESKKDFTNETDLAVCETSQSLTSLDGSETENNAGELVVVSNSSLQIHGLSINTAFKRLVEEYEDNSNYPETSLIIVGEEVIKKTVEGLVEERFDANEISSEIVRVSEGSVKKVSVEEQFNRNKQLLEKNHVCEENVKEIAEELVEEIFDHNKKSSEIIHVREETVKELVEESTEIKLYHRKTSETDHASQKGVKEIVQKSGLKFYHRETSAEINYMSEDIVKNTTKMLENINFSNSSDKISEIDEAAKDIGKNSSPERPVIESMRIELSKDQRENIMAKITDLSNQYTEKSPICIESTARIKTPTYQIRSDEKESEATIQAIKKGNNSNPGIYSVKKQTSVKVKMDKPAKQDQKTSISCRQKVTSTQNKALKLPLSAVCKYKSKSPEPKLASAKIGKSSVAELKIPTSFDQSKALTGQRSKSSDTHEKSPRFPLTKSSPGVLKPSVKTFSAKSALGTGDSLSRTKKGEQKHFQTSNTQTFSKQDSAKKCGPSGIAGVSDITPEENCASSPSSLLTKSAKSVGTRSRLPNFPGKNSTKDPNDSKNLKPKWR